MRSRDLIKRALAARLQIFVISAYYNLELRVLDIRQSSMDPEYRYRAVSCLRSRDNVDSDVRNSPHLFNQKVEPTVFIFQLF